MTNKITTFSEYTKLAAVTMMDSCKGASYLDAAFIGEVGELCSLYAKSVRGDYDLTDRVTDIKKEAGDCCWMAAMKAVQAGHDLAEMIETDELKKAHRTAIVCWDGSRDTDYLLHEIAFYAVMMSDTRKGGCSEFADEFKRHSTMFFAALSVLLDHFGFTLEDAMTANIEKLAKRKEQGKIMGNGDNRECVKTFEHFDPDAPFCID